MSRNSLEGTWRFDRDLAGKPCLDFIPSDSPIIRFSIRSVRGGVRALFDLRNSTPNTPAVEICEISNPSQSYFEVPSSDGDGMSQLPIPSQELFETLEN